MHFNKYIEDLYGFGTFFELSVFQGLVQNNNNIFFCIFLNAGAKLQKE